MVIMCIGCVAANAQSTFTQRLQQSKGGEGKITVNHDKTIDDLVNGKPEKKDSVKQQAVMPDAKATAVRNTVSVRDTSYNRDTIDPSTIDTRKKVMRGGQKVWGYRVQVYAGGNQRKDRQRAERTGFEVKTLFPNQPIYVHFYSPRWICRMGNFRTYEEAHSVLTTLRKAGYNSATIIKEKITVYQ